MAIQQPSALTTKEKKIRILIAGYPGIGKSTVGLSAPNPLHIDVDRGIDRVPAPYRKPFIQPVSYNELRADLVPENLHDFDTLVFDTGGQLIKLMSAWAISQNSKNGKADGNLTIQGYGVILREFDNFMNHCYYALQKNIVVLFHAKEEKDGDTTKLRLLVEGGTKDLVWQPMDLGGFMEMVGDKRTLGLSNCERYYAKGTHGIHGIQTITELSPTTPNDFLTRLFKKLNSNIAAETEQAEAIRAEYEAAMDKGKNVVEAIESPEDATIVMETIKTMTHHLTSEKEIKHLFSKKIKQLGYTFNQLKGVYECAA